MKERVVFYNSKVSKSVKTRRFLLCHKTTLINDLQSLQSDFFQWKLHITDLQRLDNNNLGRGTHSLRRNPNLHPFDRSQKWLFLEIIFADNQWVLKTHIPTKKHSLNNNKAFLGRYTLLFGFKTPSPRKNKSILSVFLTVRKWAIIRLFFKNSSWNFYTRCSTIFATLPQVDSTVKCTVLKK